MRITSLAMLAIAACAGGNGGVSAFKGTDPNLPPDDLALLVELIGSARYIGVGESIHTSGGYYAMKRRVIEDLISNEGVRAIAMETPRTAAASVETYIQGSGTDAKTALKGIFPVFADDNTEALIEWVATYNQAHPDDVVHFYGFDEQQPAADYAQLTTFLDTAAGSDAAGLLNGLAPCELDESTDSQGSPLPYPMAAYAQCGQGLDALDAYIAANRPGLAAATDATTEALAEVASISLRSWQGEMFFLATDTPKSLETRDIAMHAIFARLRDLFYPGVRTVIWMHNYHLQADHPDVTEDDAAGVQTFGTQLRAEIGDDYAPIALIGYDVSINWPGVGMGPQAPPDPGSVEANLHALGDAYAIVDPTGSFVGSANVMLDASIMKVSQQFRALVYLDQSPAMNALFW